MINKANLITTAQVLYDFDMLVKNRSKEFLFVLDTFPKILDWYFKVWQKHEEYLQDRQGDDTWSYYSQIFGILDSIVEEIEKRALKERESYQFFDHMKKHSDKYVEEKYLRHLFNTFYRVFFDNIVDSPDEYDIWEHHFPPQWKITKSNLEDQKNFISRISIDRFLNLAQHRIGGIQEDVDNILEEVTKNIFPEVDPIIWAKILIFVFSGYDPNNRVKSVIQRKWTFGVTGRMRFGSIFNETDFQKQIKSEGDAEFNKTIELSHYLFKDIFTKEDLTKCIQEGESLKYETGSEEDRKRQYLLRIFKSILEFIEKPK